MKRTKNSVCLKNIPNILFTFTDVLDFIQTFSQAASVDNQLQLLKTLSYESSSSNEFLQLFCEVYIKSPAKHSIRNNLSK